MLRTLAIVAALAALALAGCSDPPRPATPDVFNPRCGALEPPPGSFRADVPQPPNTYNVTLVGNDTVGWTLHAMVDAPRGSNASVVVEGIGNDLHVAEATPGEQPIVVQPLCQGEVQFPLQRNADGAVLVTFAEHDAETGVRVPVSVQTVALRGGKVTTEAWEPTNWAGALARTTVPGHFLPSIAYEHAAADGALVRMTLAGDAEGLFLARLARDGGPAADVVRLSARAEGYAPPPGASWEQQAMGDASFLVEGRGGGLAWEWRGGDQGVGCLLLDVTPGQRSTALQAQYVPDACPA